MKRSAGILPYKIEKEKVYVYLGHFGGPFWKNKKRSWGIIKGEVQEGEEDLEAAKREFFEETGIWIDGGFLDLGTVKTSHKIVHIFAIRKDLGTDIRSNLVQLEYKGKILQFPEIDKARWFTVQEAKEVIIPSQSIFLDRLYSLIGFEK